MVNYTKLWKLFNNQVYVCYIFFFILPTYFIVLVDNYTSIFEAHDIK